MARDYYRIHEVGGVLGKTCKDCGEHKPIGQFHRTGYTPDGQPKYRGNCNHCRNHLRRDRLQTRASQLRKRFGIGLEEYEAMLHKQGGSCAICGGPPVYGKGYLSVDHDHRTGKIRGLLCDSCNTGLGKFKDDDRLVAHALIYLRQYKEEV